MAAKRTVRTMLTLLVAFIAVTGVAVAPAAGDDHGDVTVGDNETGVSVDGDNTSVSVNVEGSGATVGDGGVDADTDREGEDPIDDVEEEVEGTNVRLPSNPVDAPDSPYNYSELTPFYLLPGNRSLCDTPDPDPPVNESDVPDNVSDRMPENPTPVNPFDPPSSPLTQCDIVDPYSPPFDPTNAPDDPRGGVKTYNFDVGNDSVAYSGRGDLRLSDGWPGGWVILTSSAGTDGAKVVLMTNTDDGKKEYDLTTRADHEVGTQNGTAEADVTAFGKHGGISVVCENGTCTVSPEGIPAGDRSFGGDNESGPFPCEPPVGPSDIPDPPENPTPVDPQNPPGPTFGPCEVFNPNDPPIDPADPPNDPDASHHIYRKDVDEDGVLLVGSGKATLDDGNGPSVRFLTGDAASNDSVSSFQYVRVNDGEKGWVAMTDAQFAPQSATEVGPDGARVVGDGGASVIIIGREAGARITCDGTYCTLSNRNLLLPEQEVQTARERNESDSDSGSASTTSATTTDSNSRTGGDGGGSTTDGGSTTANGYDDSPHAASSVDVPAADPGSATPDTFDRLPSSFRNGIPDAASVTGTLLRIV